MDDGRSWCMVFSLIFLACSFLFSVSASAISAVNEAKLKERTEAGDEKAVRLSAKMETGRFPERIRTTGNTAAVLSAAFGLAYLLPIYYQLILSALGESYTELSLTLAVIAAVLSVTIAVLSFGLLIPQLLGDHRAEKIAYSIAGLYPGALWPFVPVTGLIYLISLGVAHLIGADPNQNVEAVTEEDIRMMVDTGSEMGFIEESQKEMINNIFEFDDTSVGDVMTHRTEMIAVEKSAKISDVVYLATSEGFSRLPVYEGDLDNILGFIHVKDLLCLVGMSSSEDLKLDDFIRPVIYVPEHVKCRTVFAEFKKSKTAMAVVIDDYGGTEGILTMEDILESIVGEIADEYDEDENTFQQLDADTYLFEGTVELENLVNLLKIHFEEDDDYDTLGGFMTHMLGRIPKEDENPSFEYEGYEFTVMLVEERRVSKVKIHRIPMQAA